MLHNLYLVAQHQNQRLVQQAHILQQHGRGPKPLQKLHRTVLHTLHQEPRGLIIQPVTLLQPLRPQIRLKVCVTE